MTEKFRRLEADQGRADASAASGTRLAKNEIDALVDATPGCWHPETGIFSLEELKTGLFQRGIANPAWLKEPLAPDLWHAFTQYAKATDGEGILQVEHLVESGGDAADAGVPERAQRGKRPAEAMVGSEEPASKKGRDEPDGPAPRGGDDAGPV